MPKLAAPLNRANVTQALESFIKERTADKTLAAQNNSTFGRRPAAARARNWCRCGFGTNPTPPQ
jgi:hypothetical protein